jgi:hypothetical protein
MLDRAIGIEKAAAIGKGIRRDVENSHHGRKANYAPVREVERAWTLGLPRGHQLKSIREFSADGTELDGAESGSKEREKGRNRAYPKVK